jgi:hypothetical protein
MEASHILDNRRNINSLEFQVYVRLGVMPWGMDMKPYLVSKGRDANAFNKVREAPQRALLLYGGLDAWAQSELAHLPEFKELWYEG